MPREVDVGTEIETLEAAKEIVLKRFDNAHKQSEDIFAGYEFWQAFAALNDCINSIIDKENNNV